MADERSSIAQPVWQSPANKARRSLLLGAAVLVCASLAAFWPEYAGLDALARRALFILFLAAGLWISEAIPAFAVALLVMALEILLLGAPSDADSEWHVYLATWGSPLVWLFFGGFVLAGSAAKTGLDRLVAVRVLRVFGDRPPWLLLGTMGMTFVFSMFMSNTATAAMMLAVLAPVVAALDKSNSLAKALLLGVAVASNLGGMGTLIGSPPNAIAAGALADAAPVSFNAWIAFGLPPALLLLVGSWLWLVVRYCPRNEVPTAAITLPSPVIDAGGRWRIVVVSLTCLATVALWMTGSWHGLPSTVVSLLPVCVFTTVGLWTANDMRSIPWEVLLLIAGGLSLGVGIERTGLAAWIVAQFPTESIPWWGASLMFAYVTVLLSNLMSNTAATTIMVPMVLAISAGHETAGVVPIALSASAAMCLPISTPPNAIVYSSERLRTADFFQIGLLLSLAAPPLMVAWCAWMAR